MKKLTDILDEIKVNAPTGQIVVTQKGKEALAHMDILHSGARYFDIESGDIYDLVDNYTTPSAGLFFAALNLWIFSDRYGEGIIRLDNPTTKREYLDKYFKVWDTDMEGAQNMLDKFENEGLIEIVR
jgi:hypothetical protein